MPSHEPFDCFVPKQPSEPSDHAITPEVEGDPHRHRVGYIRISYLIANVVAIDANET